VLILKTGAEKAAGRGVRNIMAVCTHKFLLLMEKYLP
jgi:hypothetical protein